MIRAVALAIVCAVACGDPVTTGLPLEPLPDAVDFSGSYTVGHSLDANAIGRSTACSGEAAISSDVGIGFSGTIEIAPTGSCQTLGRRSGQVVGVIRERNISFSVSGLPDPFQAIGCSIVSGDAAFTGTFGVRELQDGVVRVVSFRGTRRLRADCGTGDVVDVAWEIRANRL